ncbi:MAG: hypothetical protein IIY10_00985, partial [Aeriscardovia sp.]|nr:hypothetical protein [Aeriscardovia sp.]
MPASLAAYRKDLEKSPDFLRLLKCSGNKTLSFPSSALIAASSMAERTCVLVLPSPKEAEEAWKVVFYIQMGDHAAHTGLADDIEEFLDGVQQMIAL